jgi:hypothetical protein
MYDSYCVSYVDNFLQQSIERCRSKFETGITRAADLLAMDKDAQEREINEIERELGEDINGDGDIGIMGSGSNVAASDAKPDATDGSRRPLDPLNLSHLI